VTARLSNLAERIRAEADAPTREESPEEKLCWEQLTRAAEESCGKISDGYYIRAALVAQARAWWRSDAVHPMSAVVLCDQLDLDLVTLRRTLEAYWHLHAVSDGPARPQVTRLVGRHTCQDGGRGKWCRACRVEQRG
jgi:hypothetical protein